MTDIAHAQFSLTAAEQEAFWTQGYFGPFDVLLDAGGRLRYGADGLESLESGADGKGRHNADANRHR